MRMFISLNQTRGGGRCILWLRPTRRWSWLLAIIFKGLGKLRKHLKRTIMSHHIFGLANAIRGWSVTDKSLSLTCIMRAYTSSVWGASLFTFYFLDFFYQILFLYLGFYFYFFHSFSRFLGFFIVFFQFYC